MIEHTLALGGKGWPVFPLFTPTSDGICDCPKAAACGRDTGKHPRTKHGLSDATTAEAALRQWWAFWPQANIGIATGKQFGWVLDIDVDKGGRASFEHLVQQYGSVRRTLRQRTGSGGMHLVFAWPEDGVVRNATGILPGIDVRGLGGYVVWAPSLHRSGRRYEVAYDGPIVPADDWLMRLVQAEHRSSVPATAAQPGASIGEGQRNDYLLRLAGALRRRGVAENTVRMALLVENDERCTPPLDTDEVDKIVASSRRWPAAPAPAPSFPLVLRSSVLAS